MINVSNEFKKLMAEDERKFLVYLDITLRDGTALEQLNNSDIWENGFKIDDGVTPNGQFTIGSCIINKLTITLNNIYDKFSAYDFDGAVVTVYMGLELSDGRIEKIRKGVYTVDEPQYDGTTITLECLDNMSRFDEDYGNVKTAYPATLGEIVRDICTYCKVAFITPAFNNYTYEVKGRPTDESLTCRQVLAYCAQLACCFGKCDSYGRLEFKWFEQGIFEKNDNLDGGIFDEGAPSYLSGDTADGGNFDDYSSGDLVDGGTFDDLEAFHHLYSLNGFKVRTDDVVVTGVQVTEEFTETEKDKMQTVTVGDAGYVLAVSGNKLIQKGAAETVAQYLGSKLIGLKFRPMSTQTLGDPTLEAGDLAYVTDRRQNTYNCLITNLSFNLGGFMNVSCDAETPGKNSAKQYSELTQAIVKTRKEAQKQASSLVAVMAQSFGVFKTEEAQENGSTIYYMHDKPTLEESMNIWKITTGAFAAGAFAASTFAVSTDGGKTWNVGMDANGNATVNILSAIGINCDWIHAGTLTLGGYNNQKGKMVMQDANGNVQGRWNCSEFYTTGPITSDNPKDNYSICINNGCCYIRGANGNTTGIISYINGGITIDSYGGKNSRLTLGNDGTAMLTSAGNITIGANGALNLSGNPVNIGNGKTGTANFSDGSYLTFKGGILTGGKTASGSTF